MMKKKEDTEKRLRMAIKQVLGKVTRANSPAVYHFIHKDNGKLDTGGYNRMETLIVQKVIATGIGIEAVIPQIEDELNMM